MDIYVWVYTFFKAMSKFRAVDTYDGKTEDEIKEDVSRSMLLVMSSFLFWVADLWIFIKLLNNKQISEEKKATSGQMMIVLFELYD